MVLIGLDEYRSYFNPLSQGLALVKLRIGSLHSIVETVADSLLLLKGKNQIYSTPSSYLSKGTITKIVTIT